MRDPAETAPLHDAGGQSAETRSPLDAFVGRDRREPLSRELIQAQKMEAIGQLVSGVAHELNNPLAAILGFSQLIRRDPALPEEMRHHADLLVEEATRTRRIVQNLLDFARQRQPERHPTPIAVLIESVLVLQSYRLGKGGIEVEVDVDPNLPLVELDRSQVQQVLVNLTQNAIHAIRARGEGGRIRISARLEAGDEVDRALVSVTDDGIGVEPEHESRLFVPFFTTKPASEGTGLGLPVSHGIVAAHGGEMRYEPGPGGRGATFTFDLPIVGRVSSSTSGTHGPATIDSPASEPARAAPDLVTATPRLPAKGSAPRGRVLVLDDERSIRVLLEKWLRASGYESASASTGEDAIELVRTSRFDVLLCDHRLAGMNGTEFFAAVVRLRPELERRFVFMSGDVLNPALRRFVEERGVGLLSKPFDLDAVGRAIAEVLAEAPAPT